MHRNITAGLQNTLHNLKHSVLYSCHKLIDTCTGDLKPDGVCVFLRTYRIYDGQCHQPLYSVAYK